MVVPILNIAATNASRRVVAAVGLVPALIVLLAGSARAQSLMVLSVNIQMAPGQKATTLTVINKGDSETAIQVRAYAWNQPDGDDQLTTSDAVLVSPPLTSIAPGVSQVVRLVLRQLPQGREATYRIVLDQIPPPAVPGTVRVVLRMSIPIFANQRLVHFLTYISTSNATPGRYFWWHSMMAVAMKQSARSCCGLATVAS
jgi:P pilus assembly chaperone PapD